MFDKSAYVLRISQANPVELVVINFEIILEFLNEANTSDNEVFRTAIAKAKDGLEQLIQSLNFEISFAHDFYEIYKYTYKLLSDARFNGCREAASLNVAEATELMQMLLDGWRETAEKTESETAANAPKVYSGLTYGRDGNANEYIEENKDRGYMA